MARLFLFVVSFLFMLSVSVFGHDGDDYKSQLYRELKAPNGSSCCSVADCKPVQSAWIEGDHWKARYNNRVFDIPDDKIVMGQESPEGLLAVICLGYVNGDPWIRCFVPPGQI